MIRMELCPALQDRSPVPWDYRTTQDDGHLNPNKSQIHKTIDIETQMYETDKE